MVFLAIVLYAVSLGAQFSARRTVQVYALWFGIFLVFQSVASPWIMANKQYYITLPTNMDYKVNIVGDGIIGGGGQAQLR